MSNVKYATLCLLITYHWHGSWAVSAWPSRRDGIATEVNGSPTDARLNIPVVKRSSNQAELTNELALALPRLPAGNVGDSREHGVEYLGGGLFERPHREYENRTIEKYTGPMTHVRSLERKKMMIGSTLSHIDETKPDEENAVDEVEGKKRRTKEGEKFDAGIKSSIRSKDVLPMVGLIGEAVDPWHGTTVGRQLRSAEGWIDYETASASTSHKRKRRNDEIRPVNLAGGDVKGTSKRSEKRQRRMNNGEGGNDIVSFMDRVGLVQEARGTRDKGSIALSRARRDVSPLDIEGRIDGDGTRTREPRENGARAKDYETGGLSNGSSSLSDDPKFAEHVQTFETSNGNPSLSYPTDINKVRDFGRLHQQSRNTKPRTIIQHLRGNVKRQTISYENDSRAYGRYAREPRNTGKIHTSEQRNRRQLASHRITNFRKFSGNPQQLRFIPSYNYGKNPKFLASQSSREHFNNDLVSLLPDNIANLPRFNEGQIDHLRKSLGGVFDKYETINQKGELPNVRTILPKQIFVAPPRLIYDTKILPAPFAFPSYPQNPGNNINDDNDDKGNEKLDRIKMDGLTISGVFDQKEMIADSERPAIPVTENSEEPETNSRNFVTPLPSYEGKVPGRANQQATVPLVSTLADEIYQVREEEEATENTPAPPLVQEYETFQRDEYETRLNHESPGAPSANDHSSDVRSSYDNSANTYANHAETGSGNVDHSTVPGAIDDEYLNHQSTRYGEVSNIHSGIHVGTSQIPARTEDGSYDRGNYKWRGDYDGDNSRYAAKYSFGYRVSDYETRNDFGHSETRDEGITRGRYHVKLPDGRIQKVNYHVDDQGYHAIVSYQLDNIQ